MTVDERLLHALGCSQPGPALRSLIRELSREGHAKAQIYQMFEEFLPRLRRRDDYRESEDEILLDVMDALTGWCHPEARLSPGETTP